MTKVQQVRKEYNETFREVVQGYGKLGYSPKSTARILDINPSWFDKLCLRFDLKKHFRQRKDYVAACKSSGLRKGSQIDQPQRYSEWYLLSILRGYSSDISIVRFNQRQHKPCADTFIKRFGSWTKAKKLAHGKDTNVTKEAP